MGCRDVRITWSANKRIEMSDAACGGHGMLHWIEGGVSESGAGVWVGGHQCDSLHSLVSG
jgi:hypothetical protein